MAPTLPKPEELPVPLLKNPDDGKVVELKKPGAAGMLTRVMSTGPMLPKPVISIEVDGPPMVAFGAGVGPVIVTCGMVRDSIVPSKARSGPKFRKPKGTS
ncbi:hypothetical protein [Mycobacterium shinjukuense]|uniref:hypothetical protein n=1 Tax=Mycobacterium shinjukuense TaxID=398694 RepID=UPI003FD77810